MPHKRTYYTIATPEDRSLRPLVAGLPPYWHDRAKAIQALMDALTSPEGAHYLFDLPFRVREPHRVTGHQDREFRFLAGSRQVWPCRYQGGDPVLARPEEALGVLVFAAIECRRVRRDTSTASIVVDGFRYTREVATEEVIQDWHPGWQGGQGPLAGGCFDVIGVDEWTIEFGDEP